MEARVLKHYLLLHDAAAEGEDGADRFGADPVPCFGTAAGLPAANSERAVPIC